VPERNDPNSTVLPAMEAIATVGTSDAGAELFPVLDWVRDAGEASNPEKTAVT
jgi:hypothetical protein